MFLLQKLNPYEKFGGPYCPTLSGIGSCSKVGGLFKLSGHIRMEKNYIPME